MKKTYNFVIVPEPSRHMTFDLDKNPYSSNNINPKTWARILLHAHPQAEKVLYKSVNGRKVYEVTR